MSLSYKDAGVDIDAGDALIERIKPLAAATKIPELVDGVGGFAGLCALPSGISDPILVSGTDGCGTKVKVAQAMGRHDTIGIDLVAMCVNDVITTGARPLFFLDYFVCGSLDVAIAESVIAGIAEGCKQAGCALLGGETAEHPGEHGPGEYDLAGFSVGVVGRQAMLGKQRVRVGDALVGLASSGLHSNGYSLARRIIEQRLSLSYADHVAELGTTAGDALLTPTRIYAGVTARLAQSLGGDLHALCHITGGGVPGNLPRVLPGGTTAMLKLPPRPALFELLARGGPVEEGEMRRTFNLGVGLVAVVAHHQADATVRAAQDCGEQAFILGEVIAGEPTEDARITILT